MSEAKILLTAEDRTRAAFESAKGGLRSVASVADAVGFSLAALGSAATVAGLVSMVKRINDTVDGFNDLADATGASIENISALERVARMTGTNIDTVSQSLIKYNQALGTTIKPGSEAEKVLGAIGLNAKALRELDPAEALRQTAVALAQYADDGNKARAVQELFGKSLKDVAPFLKDLAEQGQLVATVTTEQALEAEKFNKELYKLQAAASDAGRTIAMELVPRLNNVIDTMRESKPVVYDFWAEWANGLRRVSPGVGMLVDMMRGLSMPAAPPRVVTPDLVTDAFSRRGGRLPALALPPEEDKEAAAARKRAAAEAEAARKRAVAEAIREAEAQRKREFEVAELRNKLVEENAKRETKALAELTETMEEYAEANAKGVAEAIAAANQVEQDLSTWGKLKSEVQAVTLAQLEQSRELAALAGEDVSNIEKRIDAQKRLIAATRGMEVLDANKKAAEDAAREWQKASDQIGRSLTDALMKGGKSGADYIKDLFRTMVLRPIVQAAVQPVAGAVTNAIGIGGGAGGNLLSGVSYLNTGISGLGSGMSIANSLGTSFANMTGGGLDALLATNGAFGTATGAGAGLMSGLASALPYAGIALAVASFLESDRGGPKSEGGADLASTIQQQYNGIAAQLGITNKAIFEAFYSKDPQGDSLTQLRVATMSGGRNVYERLGEENVGRSDAEFSAAVGDATMRAIIAALKDSDLSNEYKQYLDALAADATTADMQRAIDLIGQRKALDEEWLTLTSTDAENLARARKRELEAMDPTLRVIKERIWAEQDLREAALATVSAQEEEFRGLMDAQSALMDAYNREASAKRDLATRARESASSLREARDAMFLAADSPLSLAQRSGRAASEFESILNAANGGDLEAIAKLQGASATYLASLKESSPTRADFNIGFARIASAMTLTAAKSDSVATIAEQELSVMEQQLSALGVLNTSFVSFSQALQQFMAVRGTAAASGIFTSASQLYETTAGAVANPDAAGLAFWQDKLDAATSAAERVAVANEFAWAVQNVNNREAGLPHYAAGGYHGGGAAVVGELGREVMDLATPARVYTADQTRGMFGSYSALLEEVKALRSEMSAWRNDTRRVDIEKILRLQNMDARLKKFDIDGLPPEREEVTA